MRLLALALLAFALGWRARRSVEDPALEPEDYAGDYGWVPVVPWPASGTTTTAPLCGQCGMPTCPGHVCSWTVSAYARN